MSRCAGCADSKKVMGGGMIYIDCPLCCNDDIIEKVKIDKRSKSYRDAVKKISTLHNVNEDKAADIFDDEFEKLE